MSTDYVKMLESRCGQLEDTVSTLTLFTSWMSLEVTSHSYVKDHECYNVSLKFRPANICRTNFFEYEKNRLFKIFKTRLNEETKWVVEYKDGDFGESIDPDVPIKFAIDFILKRHKLDSLEITWPKEIETQEGLKL